MNDTKQRAGAAETAAVRKAVISEVVSAMTELGRKSPDKVDLHDVDAVRNRVEQYEAACANVGLCPSLEGAAAMMGVSRMWVYRYIAEHPDDPTTEYIDRKRTEWGAVRLALAERGAVDATTAIFVSLNSNLGYSNEHRLTIEPITAAPFGSDAAAVADVDAVVQALPEPDEPD